MGRRAEDRRAAGPATSPAEVPEVPAGATGVPDDAAAVLLGLDDEQAAVATSVHGPVVVLAGAGTGKTRAITHRIAYAVRSGAHEPSRTMALTFTTRAAGEMRSRLLGLGVEGVATRTFHSAALRQLRYFLPRVGGRELPQVLPSKARIVAEACGAVGLRADGVLIRDLAADIEWAKANGFDPADVLDARVIRQWSADVDTVVRVYQAYEDAKDRQQLIDFEDVLLNLAEILRSRPGIASEVQAAYRWFTVDEYQDVNHIQHELLSLWLGERDDLCVVGDVSQTIYSFTGASSDYLTGFMERFPDATQVRLVNCYRCSGPIVDLANAVIDQSPQPGSLRLRALRTTGPSPTITAFDDDVEEATAIAERLSGLISAGTRPRDIAVLFRVNSQSAELEAALADRGIPIVMRGGERYFERAEIKQASALLRGAARAGEATGRIPDELRAVLSGMGWTSAPPGGGGAARDRWESLTALVALADEHADMDVPAFVAELDRRAQAQHAPEADAVTLASLHAAKGLEWPVVFIAGCSEGLLPIHYAQSEEQVQQERRLAYVGITRARDALHLSWARARQPGGRAGRTLSRFLQQISPSHGRRASSDASSGRVVYGSSSAGSRRAAGAVRDGAARGRRGPARCRICGKGLVTAPERTAGRCRTCPASIDEALVERIKAWRLEQARELGVPAYVICTDATLLAVAELRPSTPEQLLEIPGIGPAKLERHGAALLALVQAGSCS